MPDCGHADDVNDWMERFISMLRRAGKFPPRAGMWVSESDAAFLLGKHRNTLRNWREAGTGPRCFYLPGGRQYDLRDLAEWLLEHSDLQPSTNVHKARQTDFA